MTGIAIKEKPKTFVEALEEIEKCILAGLGYPKLNEDFKKLTDWLLTKCQTALVGFKEHAANQGKPWKGQVLLTADINEQDGLSWWHEETVRLESEIRYLLVAGEFCGGIERKEILEWMMSKDETCLLKVRHQISKIFKKEVEEEMVLLERIVELKDNMVSRVIITKNTEFSITEANFYYKPAKEIIRYEYIKG